MQYIDPFLAEQNRLAGIMPGQNPNAVQVNIPSLRGEPKRMDPSQFMKMPETPSLLEMAIAKKAAEAASQSQSHGYDPTGKTPEQIMAETGRQSELDQLRKQEALQPQVIEQIAQPAPQVQTDVKPVEQVFAETGRQADLDQMNADGMELAKPVQSVQTVQEATPSAVIEQPTPAPSKQYQGSVFGGDVTISSRAGSSGRGYVGGSRVNRGTDFAGKSGTPVALPEGEWEVVDARNDVKGRTPEDFSPASNSGWGNSVVVRNKQTGEEMRMSHMQYGSVPNLQRGEVLKGGTVIGAIGNTGNTHGATGNHLDVEYYDSQGRRGDVLNSPYAQAFSGSSKKVVEPVEKSQVATSSADLVPNMSIQPSPLMSVETKKDDTKNLLELLGLPTLGL